MFSKHFKIVALCAVLLHLADGLLATWGHSHGCVHGEPACHQVAEHHGHHHHHGECADHDHDAADPAEDEHSLPAHDDSDHCAACRHLAQAAARQFTLTELPTIERVAPLCCQLEVANSSQSAHDYQTRGPPAIAL
ncbi:MAG: hypothetical protein ACKVP0_18740 [Pirellulaceae bacterium]